MGNCNLKDRTKKFALRIIKLVEALPKTVAGRNIGNQIFRSGTSSAANYRAACRARSKKEFIAKLGIVEEEIDETLFWLELIIENKLLEKELIIDLSKEANEICAIIVSSIKTAKNNN
jgi:four helix bundle protein